MAGPAGYPSIYFNSQGPWLKKEGEDGQDGRKQDSLSHKWLKVKNPQIRTLG